MSLRRIYKASMSLEIESSTQQNGYMHKNIILERI